MCFKSLCVVTVLTAVVPLKNCVVIRLAWESCGMRSPSNKQEIVNNDRRASLMVEEVPPNTGSTSGQLHLGLTV